MEPEKIISEKILLEEQRHVHWHRDRVWQNIPREKPRRQNGMIRMAASLALVALMTLFFTQKYQEQQLQERISMLDGKIRGFKAEIPERLKTAQSSPAQENCERIALPAVHIERNTLVKHQIEEIALNDTVAVALNIPGEIPAVDTTTVTNQVADLSEDLPKIEAVIGFIPAQRQSLRSAKVKKSEKLHFGFSRDQKDFLSNEREKHTLTARIN